MNLLFWRHKSKGHVVEQKCYDKLPTQSRKDWLPTMNPATHRVEYCDNDGSNDGIYLAALAEDILLSDDQSNQNTSPDYSSDSNDQDTTFGGFGGGDFGGGGASDSWDSSDSSSSSDSYSSDSSDSYSSDSSSSDW